MAIIFIKIMITFDALALILLLIGMVKEEIKILNVAMISLAFSFVFGALSFWCI